MDIMEADIRGRESTIGIVGLGYVGLPLGIEFVRAGFRVNGYDIDDEKVRHLQEGMCDVEYLDDSTLQAALERGFSPSADSAQLQDCDIIVIAVPTGVNNGVPEINAVKSAVRTAASERPSDDETLYVIASTIYPGAVEEVVKPALENGGVTPETSKIAVVPERIDPGNNTDLGEIPVVVGANDDRTRTLASTLFTTVAGGVHVVDSTKTAACAKLLENTYRLVNISLINEFAMFAEAENVDVWDVIEAASTKPFGFQKFYPSAGAGGECIPVDPQILAHRAHNNGIRLNTIETATRINQSMPEVVVDVLERWLTERGVELGKRRAHVVGLTYKPDVADLRNSAAIEVCEKVASRARTIAAYDPLVSKSDIALPQEMRVSRSISADDIDDGDVLVYLVNHSGQDMTSAVEAADLVFDVTNSLDQQKAGIRVFGRGIADVIPSHV